MRNQFSIILSLFLITFAFSCKNQGEAENETSDSVLQMKEIVAVHDEMMPKMSTIGELTGKLETEMKLAKKDSIYKDAIADLQEANEGMMNWMRDFGGDFTFEEINKGKELSEEKEQLLDGYEKSVNEMKQKMNSAIVKGRRVLNKNN
ncbi:hypothetical protein MG296_10895 [Flavobacteriaceae bacterium TK19130]|nr:hypothetical protein [Thermobacterium salinum]